VAFWVLSSGFLATAIIMEAVLLRQARAFGSDVMAYVIVLLGFPLIAPGIALTGGIPGDPSDQPLAVWSVTIATIAWAIIGWWTLGSALWRRLRRRVTP
jgi:xanthine/uracil permease